MFWNNINVDIEKFYKGCTVCRTICKDKPKKTFGKWPMVTAPMERVHLDFFHFNGKTYLIFVDAFSKRLEIKAMGKTTAGDLERKLNGIFATLGQAKTIVTDNGPPYTSAEFKKFCNDRDIELIFTPPYHPMSNGSAERAVGTTKAV